MNYFDDIEYHWAVSILPDDSETPEMVAQIFKAVDVEDAKIYMNNLYKGWICIFAIGENQLTERLDRLCKIENLDDDVDRLQKEKHGAVLQSWGYSNYYHVVGQSKKYEKMELIARGVSPADVVDSISVVYEGFVPFLINSFEILIQIKEEMSLLER